MPSNSILIQIQHLLKLNFHYDLVKSLEDNSNTTLVKVKSFIPQSNMILLSYSNTTLVKVKYIVTDLVNAKK